MSERSKVLSSGVLLEESYRLGSLQFQVLRGAMELALPPGITGLDFFGQSRVCKRLGDERSESDEACFEEIISRAQ